MVTSRDPRCNFEIFLFCPSSTFNIRKVTVEKFSSSEVISQKSYRGVDSPSAFRVNDSGPSLGRAND